MTYSNVYAVYSAPTAHGERIAANLAATFALEGRNTLYMAANLSTSYPQRMFGVCVDRDHSIDAVRRKHLGQVAVEVEHIKGLHLLTAQDSVTAVDYDYINADNAEHLIRDVARCFERVVIDCSGCSTENFLAMRALTSGIAIVPFQQDMVSLAWLASHNPIIDRLSSDVRYVCVQDGYEMSEAEFCEFSNIRPQIRIRFGDFRHRAKPEVTSPTFRSTRIRKSLLLLVGERKTTKEGANEDDGEGTAD